MVGGTHINRFLSMHLEFGAERSRVPVPASGATSSDILRRIANGDEMAMGELYDCYAPGLYRLLLAILKSQEDAEDALQEVFLRVASGRTKRARDLRTYLYTCARHLALDTLRRRKREPIWEDAELISEVAAPEASTHFGELLGRLPIEQREVVALKVWEEMTFAEIAEVVNASPNTVASRYRYGIEKLRAWWHEDEE